MEAIGAMKKGMKIYFAVVNTARKLKYIAKYPQNKKYLKANEKLKDKYLGERCYILGNGPSLKKFDVMLLKDKHTFVVNRFYKSESYISLDPSFHCIVDNDVLRECSNDLKEIIKSGKTDTKFIIPVKAVGTLDNGRCCFVYGTHAPINSKCRCDLSKNTDAYINVIPYAIMSAIYLGFKEIVLLGCDFSQFTQRKNLHFYDGNEDDTQRKETLYQDLQGYAILYCQHECLYKYAQKNGVKIINATDGSLLDIYPMDDISNWL